MNYSEKLKDPRWQKKRLEIIKRDNGSCNNCGTRQQLQVHHLEYFLGKEPWEYDNKHLTTLCRKCHNATHKASAGENYVPIKSLGILPNKRVMESGLISSQDSEKAHIHKPKKRNKHLSRFFKLNNPDRYDG